MSYEDLQQHDVFLPESLWGKTDLSASVGRTPLLGLALAGLTACGLMVLGAGGWLTWLACGFFLAALVFFTRVSTAGVERQNEELAERIRTSG
jgi:hypothetical protein